MRLAELRGLAAETNPRNLSGEQPFLVFPHLKLAKSHFFGDRNSKVGAMLVTRMKSMLSGDMKKDPGCRKYLFLTTTLLRYLPVLFR